MKKQKYALVLSGGGFKGAFQVGALNYLAENWHRIAPESNEPMHFDLIAGISVGSLNGALLAMNKIEELNKFWKLVEEKGMAPFMSSDFVDTTSNNGKIAITIDAKKFKDRFLPNLKFKIGLIDGISMLFSKKKQDQLFLKVAEKALEELSENFNKLRGLTENDGLRRILTEVLNKDAIQDCQYMCGFVSLDDGEYCAVQHHKFITNEDFINGVIASTVMPLVWAPIPVVNTHHKKVTNVVDGGIRNVSPLGDVIEEIRKEGEDVEYKIIIINCSSGTVSYEDYGKKNAAQILLRSLNEIAITEIFNNDIALFMQINDLVKQAQLANPPITLFHNSTSSRDVDAVRLKYFDSIIIQPTNGILGETLATSPELHQRRFNHGTQKAEEALSKVTVSV